MRAAAAALITAALCLSGCERSQPADQPDAGVAEATAPGAASPAPKPVWVEWNSEADGSPRSYQAGPFNVTIAKVAAPDGLLRPVLTISDGDGQPLTLPGAEGGLGEVSAEFTVASLDRRTPGPQLLVRTFTYGAHCCFDYKLVERQTGDGARRWAIHDLGQFDGAGMPDPEDVDGDGRLELVGGDQRFLYAFTAYAFSAVPPQVQEVVAGRLVDVSADPRYRPAYAREEPEARAACAASTSNEPRPGACLAYAATMARLGRINEAWPLVDTADPTPGARRASSDTAADADCWDGRTYCDGNRKLAMISFRQKTQRFLIDNGYLDVKAIR